MVKYIKKEKNECVDAFPIFLFHQNALEMTFLWLITHDQLQQSISDLIILFLYNFLFYRNRFRKRRLLLWSAERSLLFPTCPNFKFIMKYKEPTTCVFGGGCCFIHLKMTSLVSAKVWYSALLTSPLDLPS